ncbi:MAG: hypothetical protein NTU41_03825, partial [Chloroflexi bacterium]|nr:hypothetical protein [Chloroflexota bacterium]
MKSASNSTGTWANRHLMNIAILLALCALFYYLDVISGWLGWSGAQDVLGRLHDFYGLVFFAPVVYAAYVYGLRGALLTALMAIIILYPYAVLVTSYPDGVYRPSAFGLILSAVGAAVAMLRKSDEQRRTSMNELRCLYDVGRASEQSGSVN